MEDEITAIEVGNKKYKIPTVSVGQLKKAVKFISFEDPLSLKDEDYLSGVMEFYLTLLKPDYPELTLKKLDNMPAWQTKIEFVTAVKIASMQRPLGSEKKGGAKAPPSKSS